MCELIPYEPNLKELFKECGVSQREAAAVLGVSPALVNQLLNKGLLPKTSWKELREGIASLLDEHGVQPPPY